MAWKTNQAHQEQQHCMNGGVVRVVGVVETMVQKTNQAHQEQQSCVVRVAGVIKQKRQQCCLGGWLVD